MWNRACKTKSWYVKLTPTSEGVHICKASPASGRVCGKIRMMAGQYKHLISILCANVWRGSDLWKMLMAVTSKTFLDCRASPFFDWQPIGLLTWPLPTSVGHKVTYEQGAQTLDLGNCTTMDCLANGQSTSLLSLTNRQHDCNSFSLPFNILRLAMTWCKSICRRTLDKVSS